MLRHYYRCDREQQFSEHQYFSIDELVNYALSNHDNQPEIMGSFGNSWIMARQFNEVIRRISACSCCERHQTNREVIYNPLSIIYRRRYDYSDAEDSAQASDEDEE
jgi:hypothetical protein